MVKVPTAGVEPPIIESFIVPVWISAVVATRDAVVVTPELETVSLSVPSCCSTLNRLAV